MLREGERSAGPLAAEGPPSLEPSLRGGTAAAWAADCEPQDLGARWLRQVRARACGGGGCAAMTDQGRQPAAAGISCAALSLASLSPLACEGPFDVGTAASRPATELCPPPLRPPCRAVHIG
jgi:hypothetical protein